MHRNVHPMDAEFNLPPPPSQVEEINLPSGDENNFWFHVRAIEGLSSTMLLCILVSARNNDDETLPSTPLSPTTASLRETERA